MSLGYSFSLSLIKKIIKEVQSCFKSLAYRPPLCMEEAAASKGLHGSEWTGS